MALWCLWRRCCLALPELRCPLLRLRPIRISTPSPQSSFPDQPGQISFYLFESLVMLIHCVNTKEDTATPYVLIANQVKPFLVDSKVPTMNVIIVIRLIITRAYHGIINISSIHNPQPLVSLSFAVHRRSRIFFGTSLKTWKDFRLSSISIP
jgi:hypothetical protein